jgi:tetratricopeptide (TPR) repeat protein
MTRASIALVTLALLGAAAQADCVILKKGGKLQVWGMPATIGKEDNPIEITPDNAELYAGESTGVIEAEGYDVIIGKRTPTGKSETLLWSDVVNVFYSTEPDALVAGQAEMQAGQYMQAIGNFREVVADPEARETFKYQALYLIGACYYSAGRRADCIKHFLAWKPVNSRYTPEAISFLASLLAEDRKFAEARAQCDEIPKLPGIPDAWKFKARLGAVKVDIAERKFDDAERTAQTVARETQGKPGLEDANAFAMVHQAEAIWRGGNVQRLADAAAILERAAAIEGASPGTRAFLLVTQGNILYAQGKAEEARFPYLRATLMYPDSGYDGLAYFNAGQCFLDMSMRLEGKDQAKSDEFLVDGMRLLATAAGQYRQAEAAKRYRENKPRYDAILAKEDTGAAAAAPPVEPAGDKPPK